MQREALKALQGLAATPEWADWLDHEGFLQEKGWPRFHEALLAAHSPGAWFVGVGWMGGCIPSPLDDAFPPTHPPTTHHHTQNTRPPTSQSHPPTPKRHPPYQTPPTATLADLEPTSPARARLAFDELLATQLPAALRRARERRDSPSPEAAGQAAKAVDDYLTRACAAQLPFAMTGAQGRAVGEIWGDMAASHVRGRRMVRLLQGDVGSGKTVCALLAMLRAVELGGKEGGGQAALLAPTEILAFQHQQTLEGMCRGLMVRRPKPTPTPAVPVVVEGEGEPSAAGVTAEEGEGEMEMETRPLRIEVLTSSKGRGKARRLLLEALKAGEVDVLIGTHALLGDDVVFNDLGLVVIDEEHRFGVRQRERLSNETNVLYMSATPIPRTLLLASYRDMEVRGGLARWLIAWLLLRASFYMHACMRL